MKVVKLLLLAIVPFLGSCTSEYQECLQEAKRLKEQIAQIELSHKTSPSSSMVEEISHIESEIHTLAKISGNEELFLNEIFGN